MSASHAHTTPRTLMHNDAASLERNLVVAYSKAQASQTGQELFRDTVDLLEKAHRVLMDTIKDELARLRIDNLNPTQAIIVYRIGNKSVPVGDLTSGWIYNGTNPSYNLKHLKQAGYVTTSRCSHDLRIIRVTLSEPGKDIARTISQLFERQSRLFMERTSSSVEDVTRTVETLHNIERQLLTSLGRSSRFIRR